MGLLFKNTAQLLSEASECDHSLNFSSTGIDEDIFKDIDELDELDEILEYNTEMVTVIAQETALGNTRYLVEFDILSKYMDTAKVGIKEALINVCEHNLISLGDTYLVIESTEELYSSINEAKDSIKSAKDPVEKNNRKNKLAKAKETIKDLKNKGVKVLKKKASCKK